MNSDLYGSIKSTFKDTKNTRIGSYEQYFVTLEQKYIPQRDQYAGLYDALAMLQLAQIGGSAFKHNLPSNVTIEGNYFKVDLDFYVWPHPINLKFDAPVMVGSKRNYVTLVHKFVAFKRTSKVVALTNIVQLPYSGTVTGISWDTPCYNEKGEVLHTKPNYRVENGYIIFDKVVFGVIIIRMSAVGYRYTATVYVAKSVQDIVYNQINKNMINHPECVVMVRHLDEKGKEKRAYLELVLPKYVYDYFEACPEEEEPEPEPDPEVPVPDPDPDPFNPEDPYIEEPPPIGNSAWFYCFPDEGAVVTIHKIYYDACDGENILKIVSEDLPNPCSKDY